MLEVVIAVLSRLTRTRGRTSSNCPGGAGVSECKMSDLDCCVLINYDAGTICSTRSQVTACLVRVLFRFAPKGTGLQKQLTRSGTTNRQTDSASSINDVIQPRGLMTRQSIPPVLNVLT